MRHDETLARLDAKPESASPVSVIARKVSRVLSELETHGFGHSELIIAMRRPGAMVFLMTRRPPRALYNGRCTERATADALVPARRLSDAQGPNCGDEPNT